MSPSWVEKEAQRQEGFGLHSSGWQMENSLCDLRVVQTPCYLAEREQPQEEPGEVGGKSWWQREKVLVQR